MASGCGRIEELFQSMESQNAEVVQEIKQLIYEQLSEVREAWLIHGLYDYYCQTQSPRCLEVILNIREPHDRFLCDRLQEGLKHQGEPRSMALLILGYVIRKQPSWLYRVTQHNLMKELIKVLKTEDDMETLQSALVDLIALMPSLPVQIANYLQDLFDIFSRTATLCFNQRAKPKLLQMHLQLCLYVYFQRLYGMYPCNFLAFLRAQYGEAASIRDNLPVFVEILRPMLSTVRLHPSLVTHSRDHEKAAVRWKKMEVHDVVVESSRYCLLPEESNHEDTFLSNYSDLDLPPDRFGYRSTASSTLTPSQRSDSVTSDRAIAPDRIWTPSVRCDPTGAETTSTVATASKKTMMLESPPEAAIEATPESTPFVTPVKDENAAPFKFPPRPISQSAARQLRLEVGSVKSSSVISPIVKSPYPTDLGTPKTASPIRDLQYRFPSEPLERRDSLFFERPESLMSSRLSRLGSDREELNEDTQPSPVKFTSQVSAESHIRPEPERPADTRGREPKLKVPPADVDADVDDDEVTQLTDGIPDPHLSTRHITPHICSGTASVLSSSSCQSEAKEDEQRSVFFKKVRTRMRYISVCNPTLGPDGSDAGLKRTNSMPNLGEETTTGQPEVTTEIKEIKGYKFAETQTDAVDITSNESLLVSLFQQCFRPADDQCGTRYNPYRLLDSHLNTLEAPHTSDGARTGELSLLHNQLLFERHRREVLGLRNRRLMGSAKSSRVLEEENTALHDQLQIVKSEIEDLQSQLDLIRKEKHAVEEERTESVQARDREIDRLNGENANMAQEMHKLKQQLESTTQELSLTRDETERVQADLLKAKCEVNMLLSKESQRRSAEEDVTRLRHNLLLMSELNHKEKELRGTHRNNNKITVQMYSDTFHQEMESVKAELLNKTVELEACRATLSEQEQELIQKDSVITDMKQMVKAVKDEHAEEIKGFEEEDKIRRVMIHDMENHMLELRDQVNRSVRVIRSSNASGDGINVSLPRPTQNVDITRPGPVQGQWPPGQGPWTTSPNNGMAASQSDKFVVGSPPLSGRSDSLNSGKLELFRDRTMALSDDRSPEVGSAFSAKEEAFGAFSGDRK